jgi:3-hydroxyacyl-[acyl-carrier-protein] dehydratase
MFLENSFYKITKEERAENEARFTVSILPDCDVYDGHFPGNPVCPGVCNIQTIKECAERLVGQPLTITTIKQCRLTAVATPQVCPEVTVRVNATENEGGYLITANISDEKQGYMSLKAIMKN